MMVKFLVVIVVVVQALIIDRTRTLIYLLRAFIVDLFAHRTGHWNVCHSIQYSE
jgi:hypothetical protein